MIVSYAHLNTSELKTQMKLSLAMPTYLVCVHIQHFSNPERQQVAPCIDKAGDQHCWGEGLQLGQGQGYPHVWAPQSIQNP